MKLTRRILAIAAVAAITTPLVWDILSAGSTPDTGHGDPNTLLSAYRSWQSSYEARHGDRELTLGLGFAKGLSRQRTEGSGTLTLDLETGELTATIKGMPDGRDLALWLIDRSSGALPVRSQTDQTYRVGQFTREGDTLNLHTRLDRQALWGFKLDMAAVAPANAVPMEQGLLFGAPGLFQRLYYGDRPWTVAQIGPQPAGGREAGSPAFAFLLPKAAMANDDRARPNATEGAMGDLVAEGKRIFMRETFGGNGRTCTTCHRLDNNHTIDPKYIAKLPKNDPLFVAETNPALKELENPKLLRQFGLILANIDGFDPLPGETSPPPGVFRSVPHTLAMSQSIAIEQFPPLGKGEFIQDQAYLDATQGQAEAVGWSQDGAPLDHGGSLRAFTIGAVAQHFPRTLARVPGSDFRMPTDYELDAIEAYLRSLGRSSDIPLTSLTFNSEVVERGKALFDTKENPTVSGDVVFGSTANCNGCHMNAGANSSTTFANPTRDTGVERMRDQPHHLVEVAAPYDGGFGTTKLADCGPNFDAPCYADGSIVKDSIQQQWNIRPAGHLAQTRFNTPPLYEAADTAPFFHNNSVNTIEEAVAFYSTDAFNNSPGAFTSSGKNRQGRLDSSQVFAVAAFLRALNAGENIRSANSLAYKALSQNGNDGRESARLAAADTEDAVEVLEGMQMNLYPEALQRLKQALLLEQGAALSPAAPLRNGLLIKAITLKRHACAEIVTEQVPFFCKAPGT